MLPSRAVCEQHLVKQFQRFIRGATFPCVGAKAALTRGRLLAVVSHDLTSSWNDAEIHSALLSLVARYRQDLQLFQSLAVLFERPVGLSEQAFEESMWARLQALSDRDCFEGYQYDCRVSSDPANPKFSLSFGGEAFFVVGLHPNAIRSARRFDCPTLVFNIHDQFERLRAEGRYEGLRDAIIDRDVAFSGSANPMLSQFGEISEARQYSGRVVGHDWVCPFDASSTGSPR